MLFHLLVTAKLLPIYILLLFPAICDSISCSLSVEHAEQEQKGFDFSTAAINPPMTGFAPRSPMHQPYVFGTSIDRNCPPSVVFDPMVT